MPLKRGLQAVAVCKGFINKNSHLKKLTFTYLSRNDIKQGNINRKINQ